MPIRRKNIDFTKKLVTVTSDYSVQEEDEFILADATTAELTVTLPTAVDCEGKFYQIKKKDSVNNVIVDGYGAETLDGDASLTISTQYTTVGLVSDGETWWRY